MYSERIKRVHEAIQYKAGIFLVAAIDDIRTMLSHYDKPHVVTIFG